MEKHHISALGTCIIRDIFGFHDENGGFIVDRFVQSNSPISILSQSPVNLSCLDEDLTSLWDDQKKFYKNMIELDIFKQTINYISEIQSDYLLLDIGEIRRDVFRTAYGVGTVIFPIILERLKKQGYIEDYSIVKCQYLSKSEVEAYLDEYIDKIKLIYPEEKIIFVEIRAVCKYVNKNLKQCGFFDESKVSEINEIMISSYEYLKTKLKRAHFIPFPENMLADFNHKWGLSNIHYIKEYYEYALKSVKIISSKQFNSDLEIYLIMS